MTASSSYYPILPSGPLTGATGTDFVAPSYGSNPASGMVAYPAPMMPPISSSQLYSPHLENTGPQSATSGAVAASSRFLKPEETNSPTRHPHSLAGGASSATSPLLSTSLGHIGGGGGGSMPRHRGSITEHSPGIPPTSAVSVGASGSAANSSSINQGGKTPQVPKSSPLSLSSITSPYRPDSYSGGASHLQAQTHSGSAAQHQPSHSHSPHLHRAPHPKNSYAQTLILGERLRPGSEDPAIIRQVVVLVICIWRAVAVVVGKVAVGWAPWVTRVSNRQEVQEGRRLAFSYRLLDA
ncbi:hypothetical protein BJ165DRAFT_421667 [Panaeolus papilionaceus]|nr:hypothetical protein BJ165DRAFT_421667 [Panaeolus papilionaceus]